MKNTNTLLLNMFLTVLCFGSVIQAQSYHPMPVADAQWNVARCWYFYPEGWHDLYFITMDGTDTVINQTVYKKLYHTTHHAPGTEFDSTYTHFLGGMREAGKQVFMVSEWLCLDTIERMIYDFNDVEVGEYIYTQVLTNGLTEFIPHLVDGVGDLIINGEHRRQIHLQDVDGNFHETWIEGIGSNLGLVYATYWQLTDNSYDLQCFYEGSVLDYTNPCASYAFCQAPFPDSECELILSDSDVQHSEDDIFLYPNPVTTTLHIEAPEDFQSIEVYSVLGIKVLESTFTTDLNLTYLQPGIYVVNIRSASGKSAVKRFLKV